VVMMGMAGYTTYGPRVVGSAGGSFTGTGSGSVGGVSGASSSGSGTGGGGLGGSGVLAGAS
jgi:hypothetical protein